MRRLSDAEIARVCHAANTAYQGVIGQSFVSEPWDALTRELRESVIAGVYSARICASAREHHEHWLAWRGERGWRWGPVKDDQAKTHPLFVPWNDLPDAEQEKDRLFIAIVRELDLAAAS
jgi:hypothetical protein